MAHGDAIDGDPLALSLRVKPNRMIECRAFRQGAVPRPTGDRGREVVVLGNLRAPDLEVCHAIGDGADSPSRENSATTGS